MRQLRRVPKVRQLHIAILIRQDVVTLYVTMDYISGVEVLQAAQGLSERPLQGILRVELFPTSHSLDDRSYSSIHELNKNPKNASVIIVGIDNV